MPNDSRPVAGETYTSAVRNSCAFSSSETRPRNSTPWSRRVAMYRRASRSCGPPPTSSSRQLQPVLRRIR